MRIFVYMKEPKDTRTHKQKVKEREGDFALLSDAIINSRLPTKEEACRRPTKKERDAAGENTLMGWDKIINPK